jgi:hypothetical protein
LKKYTFLTLKNPLLRTEEGMHHQHCLFLSPRLTPAGIGTVLIRVRCRGFIGPVPLPLWIRNYGFPIKLIGFNTIAMQHPALLFRKTRKPSSKRRGQNNRRSSSSYLSGNLPAGIGTVHQSAAEVS